MSGVTPSWLQEIRDYWAELAQEQRETETRHTTALPQGDNDTGGTSLQTHPQMMVAGGVEL
jgi:hypothetical protein